MIPKLLILSLFYQMNMIKFISNKKKYVDTRKEVSKIGYEITLNKKY